MAKYGMYSRRPSQKPRPWDIHPVWRGIGCLLVIIIPIMAYAGAVLLVRANLVRGWLPVPAQFARSVTLPLVGRVPYLFANLAVAVVLAVFAFVALTVVYALLYRLVGPPREGPTDAPPVRKSDLRRR